jgi:23S rRNA pseudouridine2457 synthase
MPEIILLNKPYQVLCQFTDASQRATLANYMSIPNVYPAGRLDYDSEGLVLLTSDGKLQHLITDPKNKLPKTYLVQVEGLPSAIMLKKLALGIHLNDGLTLPAHATSVDPPKVWPRVPPIRERKSIPTAWIKLIICEGRNRQVRRMTAAIGHPTLRLIRIAIGDWQLGNLQPGEWQQILVFD